MLKPSLELFNTTATLSRKSDTVGNYYETSSPPATIASNIPFRLTTNRWFGVAKVQEQGFQSQSSHRGYSPVSDDYVIKDGDFILVDSETYRINLSDGTPGGVSDSHYELWMSKVKENNG